MKIGIIYAIFNMVLMVFASVHAQADVRPNMDNVPDTVYHYAFQESVLDHKFIVKNGKALRVIDIDFNQVLGIDVDSSLFGKKSHTYTLKTSMYLEGNNEVHCQLIIVRAGDVVFDNIGNFKGIQYKKCDSSLSGTELEH